MDRLTRDVLHFQQAESVEMRRRLADSILEQVGPLVQLFIRTRCPADAQDDIIQETFIAMFQKCDQFVCKKGSSFQGWACTIARNEITNAYRKRRREIPDFIFNAEDFRETYEAVQAQETLSASELMDLELALELIGESDPACRELMVNHHIFGLNLTELAEMQQASYDAMRMKLNRCEAAAKELLGKLA